MDKCHVCGSEMKKEKVKIRFKDETVKVDGARCMKCDEVLLDPEQAQRLLQLNKLLRGVEAKVGKLGKSLIVRLPADVKDFLDVSKGDSLVFKTKENKLLIEKT